MIRIRRRAIPAAVILVLTAIVAACSAAGSPSPAAPSASAPAPASTPAATPRTDEAATATPTSAPTVAPTATPAPTEAAFPLTVSDDTGVDVTLPAVPGRVVSLTPATTEILFAINAGERIVARSEDPNPYPAGAQAIPAVTNMGAVDVEKIVALQPDLVIAGGLGFTPDEAIAKLRSLKIPVVTVYAPDVATVLADVRLTGRLVGKGAAGEALAASMQADIDAIAAAAAPSGGARPRTFYEIDATGDIYGPADKSFLAEMIRLAGGDPITTGSPTLYSVPLERLISADPQIILLGDAAYGTTAGMVAGRAGWSVMTAVKAGAIRPVDDVIITRPGPRLPEGLRALALAISPGAAIPSLALPPSPGASAGPLPSPTPTPAP